MFSNFYQSLVLKNPRIVFLILILITSFFLINTKDFRLDASSETLLIEGDPDLEYLNEINQRYKSKDFLVLTFTPKEALTSESSINNILSLKYKIQSLDWVHNVVTILDVPLLESSDEPLMDRIKNFRTLKDENIDKDRAFDEILNSPVFKNLVISEDATTTGIIVNLKRKKVLESSAFDNEKEFEEYKDKLKSENHENIEEIREVIKSFKEIGRIHLGGIPMIADDMMTFIKKDIIVFGIGVFAFIIITLWFVFRKVLWITIPISSCFFAVIIMVGFLGLMNWKVTVISSNFIAMMLILTMAMNIHISTRYIQLTKTHSDLNNYEILKIATSKMVWPILYTVLTTICAFLSLIFSGIKPIIDFGWMMTFGLMTSFLITFTLLPALLGIFYSEKIDIHEKSLSFLTNPLSKLSIEKTNLVFFVSIFFIVFSIFGISKLKVENSFINYFSKDTEIYQGMKLIDEKLGGTTPLEIILKFSSKENDETDEDDEFKDWDDEGGDESKYWFTKDKIDKINKVHNYLENTEHVGKVLSFSSIIQVATKLNNNKELGTLEMGVLYSKIPETVKSEIIDPYISIKDDEARISLRIKDSSKDLRRNDLIKKINFAFLFFSWSFLFNSVLIFSTS